MMSSKILSDCCLFSIFSTVTRKVKKNGLTCKVEVYANLLWCEFLISLSLNKRFEIVEIRE